jgi:4-hydroxythreonine-4-phosphate dehydrogenase
MACIRAAVKHCMEGASAAMITAPISKEAISMAGYDVPGHTEYLQRLTDSPEVGMVLASGGLRVGLVTIHMALSSIFSHITKDNVLHHIVMMHNALRRDFGIASPKIAVLGLNPHAGDGGVLGKEEITVIGPAIRESHMFGINATGPFPADGFFGNKLYASYDGVLAMYHDQGLIPFKTIAFHDGVNITIGLPIVRTSPDHGTAFAIAGKGVANAESFQSAIQTSLILASNRS